MKIEKSLDEAAVLISQCWDLRYQPNDLEACRIKLQKLVADLIEAAQKDRGALPVKQDVIQKLGDLLKKIDALDAKLRTHRTAIDTVIFNAVQSDQK
jgi:hypothetical protein